MLAWYIVGGLVLLLIYGFYKYCQLQADLLSWATIAVNGMLSVELGSRDDFDGHILCRAVQVSVGITEKESSAADLQLAKTVQKAIMQADYAKHLYENFKSLNDG